MADRMLARPQSESQTSCSVVVSLQRLDSAGFLTSQPFGDELCQGPPDAPCQLLKVPIRLPGSEVGWVHFLHDWLDRGYPPALQVLILWDITLQPEFPGILLFLLFS